MVCITFTGKSNTIGLVFKNVFCHKNSFHVHSILYCLCRVLLQTKPSLKSLLAHKGDADSCNIPRYDFSHLAQAAAVMM